MVDVTVSLLDSPSALYRRYESELAPQPCFVSLDLEDGELTAGYNGGVGYGSERGVPESVWHGRTLRWDIPCLTADAANDLLEQLTPLASRVLTGAKIQWDGNSNVGVLDDDAAAAEVEIGSVCEAIGEDYPQVREWDAADWFAEGDVPDVAADASDEALDELAERLRDEAANGHSTSMNSDDVTVLFGVEDFLLELRDASRERAESGLVDVAEDIDRAEEKRDELIVTVSGWASTRRVGELAGLSHTHVQRIVAKRTGAGVAE